MTIFVAYQLDNIPLTYANVSADFECIAHYWISMTSHRTVAARYLYTIIAIEGMMTLFV